MRYWWVNQNQTFRQEITGGYLWSPKRNADGKQQIYVRWMDSGQTARITNLEQTPEAIAWSPDASFTPIFSTN